MKPKIKITIVKKIINVNERERQMIDEANEMGVHNIKYYLPNKETVDRENVDVRIGI